MADERHYSVGSVVACTDCFDEVVEGEVIGFEPAKRMLVLKCPSTSNNTALNNINIVNLAFAKNVQIKKESNNNPQPLPSIDVNRLQNRLKVQIQNKKLQISAMSANISPEAQKLYLTMSKTISEVFLEGQNIVVYGHVIISPPYKPENVNGSGNQEDIVEKKAVAYIKNIVNKHIKDVASQQVSSIATTHQTSQQDSSTATTHQASEQIPSTATTHQASEQIVSTATTHETSQQVSSTTTTHQASQQVSSTSTTCQASQQVSLSSKPRRRKRGAASKSK